jgi:hypothetical protein
MGRLVGLFAIFVPAWKTDKRSSLMDLGFIIKLDEFSSLMD